MQRATFLAIALAASGCGNSPHDTEDARVDAPAQDGATPGDAGAQDGSAPDDGSALDATSGTDASADSAPADDGTSGGDASAQPHIQTVFVIAFENKSWSEIHTTYRSSAPYINNTLLPMAAHAEHYTAARVHPSLPNYLWLEAGTNFGVLDDNPPASHHFASHDHLVHLLEGAGVSWMSYQEGINEQNCPLTTADGTRYAPKHDPFVYFDDVTDANTASSMHCKEHHRAFSHFAADLAAGTVARYNFITPDLCNDMHDDCMSSNNLVPNQIQQGDTWLSTVVPMITGSDVYRNGGALFIVWDGDETHSGLMPSGMIVVSPFMRSAGYSSSVALTHSSTLLSLQRIFGVDSTLLGGAATEANDLRDLFAPGMFP